MNTENSTDRNLVWTRLIKAPGAQVYCAWTDTDMLKQWFAPADMLGIGRRNVSA